MTEKILNWVNIYCEKKGDKVLLLNRQHDDFKGWIQPGGKVEFVNLFEAAVRELKEETGLIALNLQLKAFQVLPIRQKQSVMSIMIFYREF